MIKSIWIDNFKSLVNFELPLSKFTCLVGLNGSGKSSVLQAMDFVSQLMFGDLDEWLKRRHWESSDINSRLTKESNIEFRIVINVPAFGELTWSGTVNRTSLRCTQEQVKNSDITFLRVEDGKCSINKIMSIEHFLNGVDSEIQRFPIIFEYQGSILSQLKDTQTNLPLHELKKAIAQIRSLDLLSPELLRSRTKFSDGKLGLGGERLSAFLHESGKEGRKKLKDKLKTVYTQLDRVDTRSLRSGWKQLEIMEHYGSHKLKTQARHINDGMLRLMAVLSQLESESEFLLFDEIENGINPELVEFLIDNLVNAKQQVMVTTHSPMILNFLEDETARQGVVYLYKTEEGFTRAKKFFQIPSQAKKLEFMGPGEAFIDTDLTQLYSEITNLD